MSPAMLSRFDLIFLMLDRPDHALDKCLAEHVLALQCGAAHICHAAGYMLVCCCAVEMPPVTQHYMQGLGHPVACFNLSK